MSQRHIIYRNKTSFPYLSSDLMHTLVLQEQLFSLYNEANVTKLLGQVLCILLEGSLSQNLDLGLRYFLYFVEIL